MRGGWAGMKGSVLYVSEIEVWPDAKTLRCWQQEKESNISESLKRWLSFTFCFFRVIK